MLRSFTLENFQSFRDSVRISLELNGHPPEDGRSVGLADGTRLSKAVTIIGPNASGKTALLKSLVFVDWFVRHSFQAKPDEPIPLFAHFSRESEPSTFEVSFQLDGREWRYRLRASRERVYHESLYSRQTRSFSYVFVRDWSPGKKGYVVKQRQFGLLGKEAGKVRENASLISTAAQYEVPLALRLLSANVWSNVHAFGRLGADHNQLLLASDFYAGNANFKTRMAALLHEWDFGLIDVQIEKQAVRDEGGTVKEINVPFGVHRVGGREHRLMFLHESSGTQGAFVLLSRILPALQYGGLAVIDELEADLHPHMLAPLLDLFFSPATNPHHAQILFTSHSIEVLSLLHKAQVVLVEKDDEGVSDAWRLDSLKGVRADDNLYAKYMAGAYGAIPQL
ncbi:MAG: abortive infection protein [Pelodictyon luteolum]|uniref:Abortive infection protein, internal deletion n=2 Tax=Pelodictyon luteolum TaxID=1100 RepID=Q3B1N6_CHLL3|nr:ATP-binding protein [Pelodictyon luteolum]ABB24745.1 abortive infection protein, internal deletion [Pelodictyon luteolum DSM 273]KZK75311.1 MAG: abortive infection protein [Pelodictyon luteolum]